MKKHSKEMKEVLKIVDKLRPIFFLQGWDIDVGVHKYPLDEQPNTAAQIKSRNAYRAASLEIYPRFFEENAEAKQDIIIHEFCHIMAGIQNGLVNASRTSVQVSDSEAIHAYEEETSWFANIINRLIP